VDRELPKPGSDELKQLVTDEEPRVIYEYLYERRDDPPTMLEVREHIASVYGEPHSQTDRRVRGLRDVYLLDVRTERAEGQRDPVYRLAGFRKVSGEGRKGINARERAEILTRYGSRCAMCGKTPKDDGVKLVIDHIVPLDWLDTDDPNNPENLQPLCEECNSGKKAHYSSFDEYADAIKAAMSHADAHTRIGELMKALEGQPVPSELIAIVAKDTNAGDYLKRLRELRYPVIGWVIKTSKKKVGRRTRSYYTLMSWKPYPTEGAKAAVAKYERERARSKAARDNS